MGWFTFVGGMVVGVVFVGFLLFVLKSFADHDKKGPRTHFADYDPHN